jgi:hypothetical protein
VTYCAISLAVTTVTFALSLSLIKALSACVIKLASRWELGPLPDIALLGVHVILLIYWTPLSGYRLVPNRRSPQSLCWGEELWDPRSSLRASTSEF